MYTWDWSIISAYKSVFIEGALVTLWLTLLVAIFGTILGVILALLKRSDNPVIAYLTKIYIELFRSIPILVLLIWIFYVLPLFIPLRLSPFIAALIALSLHLSAFVAESVRAGIESIPKNQFESGLALGLGYWQIMGKIIFPQALKNIIPNLLGLYITELKNSSLASIIAVNELLHRANILISNTYRPLEIYTTVAIAYLIIIIPFVLLVRYFEIKIKKKYKTI